MKKVSLKVNGRKYQFVVDSNRLLIDLLRASQHASKLLNSILSLLSNFPLMLRIQIEITRLFLTQSFT